ncbi:MAG: sulfite exporter TauE/SafE family protein [Leptospiraceae bacterium]|nr:sulfite exporter TauE/SafE family protein [Leptospiraceae bacterium]MCP5503428.1 sulfite exporter TauE/SafE family protein [Leptospiraceae bacterium]
MELSLYLIIFFVALFAFTIAIVAGGGGGLLLIPLLGVFLPATRVPAALTIGTLSSTISKLALFRELVDKRIVKGFVPASLPGAALGVWLLANINTNLVELFIGLFLVSNLPLLLFSRKTIDDAITKPVSMTSIVLAGFIAGLISALIGAVGVLFNRFYYRCGLNKDAVIATRAANEITLHVFKLILYAFIGLINIAVFKMGIVMAIAAILVALAGKSIIKKISTSLFKQIGHVAMVLSGTIMLHSASVNIITRNNPQIRLKYLEGGIDGQLHWSSILYIVEFRFEEGFEFEHAIQFEELPEHLQATYADLYKNYLLTVEKVYSFEGISYELYVFNKNHKLLKKINHE